MISTDHNCFGRGGMRIIRVTKHGFRKSFKRALSGKKGAAGQAVIWGRLRYFVTNALHQKAINRREFLALK